MYDILSQVFLGSFAMGYLVLLTALIWWALAGRLRSPLKKRFLAWLWFEC
jgi:hypothetical protein